MEKLAKRYKVEYWELSSRWGAYSVSRFFPTLKKAFDYFKSLNRMEVYLDDRLIGITILIK